MYEISKRMEIAGSHNLCLPYESKCQNRHGHNWIVTVYVEAEELQNDMVIDFTELKRRIHDVLDHQHLNDVLNFNPTAENIAAWIAEEVNLIRQGAQCTRVTVQESEGNIATWKV
jgi:6-pyruvoyltetrahydropterin/6-carboxytetrahydropterin synthase